MGNQQFKADGGKTKPDLIELGFPRALRLVQATTDYGSEKYEEHSWRSVDDGFARYQRAYARHRQDRILDGNFMSRDKESNLPHVAHELFNLMAMMELYLQENDLNVEQFLDYNPPPTAHKKSRTELLAEASRGVGGGGSGQRINYAPMPSQDKADELMDDWLLGNE